MLQSSAIEEALKFIASHPEIALKFLNAELEMPNIPKRETISTTSTVQWA